LAAVSHEKPIKIRAGCARVKRERGRIGSAARRSIKVKIGMEITKADNRDMTAGCVQG
jgi:hypothetical protein